MNRIAISLALAGTLAFASMQGIAAQPAPAANPMVRGPQDGGALFRARCGYCHLEGGTGTMMLERRLGKENRLLAERRDLQADYVKAVVRHGINSMPTITRVEVTDQELGLIAAFLSAPKPRKASR